MQIALNAVRIHGGHGYSTEFDVGRYFREAPLMIIGEEADEIQRNVIVRQLVARGGLDIGPSTRGWCTSERVGRMGGQEQHGFRSS